MLLRAASSYSYHHHHHHHHLPRIPSPTLFAVGLFLIPPPPPITSSTLHSRRRRLSLISSSSSSSSSSSYSSTTKKSHLLNSPQTIRSLSFRRVSLSPMPLLGHRLHPCSNATASFSTGSSSEVGREILVQHLLVKEDDLQLLVELQKRVSEGEDLSDLAVEYSICPSKEEGGMLGWVRKGQMVPEFEEAAFSATLNKVVRCKTKFGWHLLQVLSEREESILEDIQPSELHVKMQDPSFLEEAQLIDVREPEEVDKASLPGFQVLPLRQFGSWGPEITAKFDAQKDTYVMCHHGMRSLQVAKWLHTQAFRFLLLLEHKIEWTKEGDILEYIIPLSMKKSPAEFLNDFYNFVEGRKLLHGFRRVFNVAGGIHEYAVKVDPSIPTY